MPEMKLKNQNLLHNFKSNFKSLETKIDIIERLENCLAKAGLTVQSKSHSNAAIKNDIKKVNVSFIYY